MTEEHIERIMNLFDTKKDEPNVAKLVDYKDIEANDYNLSVSSYAEAKDTREVIDINVLNAELFDLQTPAISKHLKTYLKRVN